MEPVYNVTLLENTTDNKDIIEDDGVIWGNPENEEHICASFEFDVPRQQLQKFLKKPAEHLPCLTVAAKKSRNEVTYSELNAQGKSTVSASQAKGAQVLVGHEHS